MRKKTERRATAPSTLRAEYDFQGAKRGLTAKRYTEGSNVVSIDADLVDVFPDAASVNEALRALAGVIRTRTRTRARGGRSS
jgi:hypothetical protein